jgi:hypothetical protein
VAIVERMTHWLRHCSRQKVLLSINQRRVVYFVKLMMQNYAENLAGGSVDYIAGRTANTVM